MWEPRGAGYLRRRIILAPSTTAPMMITTPMSWAPRRVIDAPGHYGGDADPDGKDDGDVLHMGDVPPEASVRSCRGDGRAMTVTARVRVRG